MLYAAVGSKDAELTNEDLGKALAGALEKIGRKQRVLIIPPDFTRFHSRSGTLTEMAWESLGSNVKCVLPALGTHFPMSEEGKTRMFGRLAHALIRDHEWREGLAELGRLDGTFMETISGGRLDFDWPVQVNRLLVDDPWDLILSIGQVVPHEIVGMANYTKNIMVGVGGQEGIDKSHFLGAVCGMENLMGRGNSPVRQLFNRGARDFCAFLPIVYVLTVVSVDSRGRKVTRGIFIGDDEECYNRAVALSQQVNIVLLDRAPEKVIVSLEPEEFRSTWLGNKSIYRTRMAIADGGELVVLAPGVHCFGENEKMDRLIRKFGYRGTDAVLAQVAGHPDLEANLSVAAHLIHGSSEGRFRITYCPGGLSREEVEAAGYEYGDPEQYGARYGRSRLEEGWNRMPDGEEIFYISNPALGLWALKECFGEVKS